MSDDAMRLPVFVRYWTASTTGSFGSAVSTVAVQVLVVQVLVATPAEVGVVNAARVLPYAFLGVFAGVLIDRVRRKPAAGLVERGAGGLLGSLLAVQAGRRLGAGGATLLGFVVAPVAWGSSALVPPTVVGMVLLGAAQVLAGFGMGVGNANSLGYRQSVTPDELQGRMNATIRSMNRTCAVVGALCGGLVGQLLGLRPALWVAAAMFAVAAVVVYASPLRTARHGFDPD